MGKVLIIAEAGVNHNGSSRKISLQEELVKLVINKETWEASFKLNCKC